MSGSVFKSKQELILLSLSEGIDLFDNINYSNESIDFLKKHLNCTYEQAYLYLYFIENNIPEYKIYGIDPKKAYQLMKIARSGHPIEGFLNFSRKKLIAIRRAIKYNLLDMLLPYIDGLNASKMDFIISCELKGIPYLKFIRRRPGKTKYPIYIQIYNYFIKNNLTFPIHDELIYFKPKTVLTGLNKGLTMDQIHKLLEDDTFKDIHKYDKDFYNKVIPYLHHFRDKNIPYHYLFDLIQKGLTIESLKGVTNQEIRFLYFSLKENFLQISDCEKILKFEKLSYIKPDIKYLFIKDYISNKYDESFFYILALLKDRFSYDLVSNASFQFKDGTPIDIKQLYHFTKNKALMNNKSVCFFSESAFLTGLALVSDELQDWDELKEYFKNIMVIGNTYSDYKYLANSTQKEINEKISLQQFFKKIIKFPLYIVNDIGTSIRRGENLSFLPLLLKAAPEELFNYHIIFNEPLNDYIEDYLINHPSAINCIDWIKINVKCKDDLSKISLVTNPEQLLGGL